MFVIKVLHGTKLQTHWILILTCMHCNTCNAYSICPYTIRILQNNVKWSDSLHRIVVHNEYMLFIIILYCQSDLTCCKKAFSFLTLFLQYATTKTAKNSNMNTDCSARLCTVQSVNICYKNAWHSSEIKDWLNIFEMFRKLEKLPSMEVGLTHDLDLQSPASCGHDLLTSKSASSMVNQFWR